MEPAGNGTCLVSGVPMPFDYIRSEGKAGGWGRRLMAIVAEGPNGRVYLPPTDEQGQLPTGELPVERRTRISLRKPSDFVSKLTA